VIDLHSHILPGLDDGARTLDDSLDVARAAVADGTRVLVATPHVTDRYPTAPDQMEAALAQVRDAVAAAEIPLDVRGGGEIALDRLDYLDRDGLRRLTLGGGRHLLLETPYRGWPLDLPDRLFRLQASGFAAVLAHPERNSEVRAHPERLRPLVERGLLVQVTAASLDGRLGGSVRAAGLALVERGLAHVLASDAHTADVRAVGLAAAARAVGDEALARWLTQEVPAAVLQAEPVPPRPRTRRRRRRLFFLR
jgi:protein-tyrosine phosphatase